MAGLAASTSPASSAPGLRAPVALLLRAASLLRGRRLAAHGLGLGLFALALALRFAVDGQLSAGFPFLTFFPVIVLTTFFCGRGPGVVCGVLSVLSAWYWFLPPHGSFALSGSGALAVAFFILICAVDILVIDLMLTALSRQTALQRQTDALLAQRTVLFQELQHRVANNLMLMGGVLGEQERRLSHLPAAREALADVRRRFDMLSRLHRQLHDPERLMAPAHLLLPALCSDLLAGLGHPAVVLSVEVEPVALDVEPKLNLCLLVMELVTNAAKHAFAARADGQLWVRLAAQPGGLLLLRVEDDGPGPADAATARDTDAARGLRLGMRIAHGLARSLQGELVLAHRDGGGTSAQVRFRPPQAAHPGTAPG